jgi:hypothetical protein
MRVQFEVIKHGRFSVLPFVCLTIVLSLIVACGTFEIGLEHESASAPAVATATRFRTTTAIADLPIVATPAFASTNIDQIPNQSTMVASFAATETRAAEMVTPFNPTDPTVTAASGEATDTRAAASSGSATDTPAPLIPTSTTFVEARLYSFDVTPRSADPGDTVTLNWSASGESATICPSARYVLFTSGDCRAVPLSGSMDFTIPSEAAGFSYVSFLLTVASTGSPTPAVQEISVALKCQLTWFFSDEPLAGVCPTEPISTYAAAQSFERGKMIWLEQPGHYIILEEALMFEGEERKHIYHIYDPLEIVGDTSGDVHPPDGLFAPVSGFGLVWRGDVSSSPGFRETLGWALAPEVGYDAVFQCDDAQPSGGRSWQSCYLKGPQGEIIFFHPLGGWTLLQE